MRPLKQSQSTIPTKPENCQGSPKEIGKPFVKTEVSDIGVLFHPFQCN